MMIDELNPVIEFNAQDRCDGCGAQARTLATRGNQDLKFCVSHAKRAVNTLAESGWTIRHDYAGYAELGYDVPELVFDGT